MSKNVTHKKKKTESSGLFSTTGKPWESLSFEEKLDDFEKETMEIVKELTKK
jgi:hypothetical protein